MRSGADNSDLRKYFCAPTVASRVDKDVMIRYGGHYFALMTDANDVFQAVVVQCWEGALVVKNNHFSHFVLFYIKVAYSTC